MKKWKRANIRITAAVVALVLLGCLHVFAEEELNKEVILDDGITVADPENTDETDIKGTPMTGTDDELMTGIDEETDPDDGGEMETGLSPGEGGGLISGLSPGEGGGLISGLSPGEGGGLISELLPGGGMGTGELMTPDGAGDKYGGYEITNVVSNDVSTNISTSGGVYLVSGISNKIISVSNANCVIVLNGAARTYDWAALQIRGTSNVTVYLAYNTTNTFKATGTDTGNDPIHIQSGIEVESTATLKIEGPGTLNAIGGKYSAGIGSHFTTNSGKIIIESGVVNATGGENGAGIGSGWGGTNGTVTINGGTVNATGGAGGGAGIGGGKGANGGTINITGGIVEAKSGDGNGSGIGGGGASSIGTVKITGGSVRSLMPNGDIKINNNAPTNGTTSLTLVRVKVVDENAAIIPGAEISVPSLSYNATANSGGLAYLWLPQGAHNVTALNPENEAEAEVALNVGAPSSTYASATIDKTIEISGGGILKARLSANPSNAKAYSPGDNVTLTLAIPTESLTGFYINEIKWFRESVAQPVYTKDNFDAGYSSAIMGKGILDNPVSSGQETHYSMAADKNGRYWIQIKYTDISTQAPDYKVDRIDIDNIYTQVDVKARDWNDTAAAEAKGYTLLEGAPYGIPFDLNDSTILPAPRLGFDTVTYNRNTDFPPSGWAMTVPGSPFGATPANASLSTITLNTLVNDNADVGSTVMTKMYTVKYKEGIALDGAIDLSKASTALAGLAGVTASPAWNEYKNTYPLADKPTGKLYFGNAANGKTYKISQSCLYPASSHALKLGDPKFGTTNVSNIIIDSGVKDLTLIISDIHLIEDLIISSSAKVTLLLDGKSYIRGQIDVSNSAEVTIGSFNGNNTTDRLIFPQQIKADRTGVSDTNSNARIGGAGGGTFTHGSTNGTITINGGKIDITTFSAGAGIGGGGTLIPANAGSGGNITINGGEISIVQYASSGNNGPGSGPGGAGIGGGGGRTNNTGNGAGNLLINGGTVNITQYSRAAGIGGGTYGPAGNITISGGNVNVVVKRLSESATDSGVGAAIGTPGCSNPGTGSILISGGTVNVDAVYTGIGRVHGDANITNYVLDITITGGTVNAKSIEAPAIGYWEQSRGNRITITGGTVTAASEKTTAIGSMTEFLQSAEKIAKTKFYLDAAADVRAYSGSTGVYAQPAINVAGRDSLNDYSGDGYFVNATFDAAISETEPTTLYVFGDRGGNENPLTKSHALLKILTLPTKYRHFAYSSDLNKSRTDEVIVHGGPYNARVVIRKCDESDNIYSVKARNGYSAHGGVGTTSALPVKLSGINQYFIITEKHVDAQGNTVMEDTEAVVMSGNIYNKEIVAPSDDYTIDGYFVGVTFTPGNYIKSTTAMINPLTSHETVFFVYIPTTENADLTIYNTTKGKYGDRTSLFNFTVSFSTDEAGTVPLSGVASFQTVDELDQAGELPLVNGKVTFTLKGSQSITLKGVPKNSYISIEETEDENYDTSFKDSANFGLNNEEEQGYKTIAPRLIAGNRFFEFINDRREVANTEIHDETPMAMVTLLALTLSLSLIILLVKEALRRRGME